MRATEPFRIVAQGQAGCSASKFRRVVLLRQMRKHELSQAAAVQFLQKLAGLNIGQMTELAADAPLEHLRIRAIRQHLHVVIEFEQQRIAGIERALHMWRRVAQIRHHPESLSMMIKAEMTGFARIVWHRKRVNLQFPDLECLVRRDVLDVAAGPILPSERCSTGHHQRNLQRTPDTGNAAEMVAMFMGHQHSTDRRQVEADPCPTGRKLTHTETAVHENPRAATLYHRRVAVTPAPQDRVTKAQDLVSVP